MTMIKSRAAQTRWTAAMRTEGHSADTIRRRTGTIRRIEHDTGHAAATLSIDEITTWLARYPAAGTRAAYFGDLQAYYAWHHLIDDTFIAPTDRVKRPRQPKRRPRPITTAELFRGLDTATGDLLIWINLGAYQGLRVSEAAAVAGQNISAGAIRVFGKGDSDKTIPLSGELAQAAADKPQRGWWFPTRSATGHITAHTIGQRVNEHFAEAGVEGFTYHRLRHWCGTEMLRAGASLREVQEFLRHEAITSTAGYTEVLQHELVAAEARLPRRGPDTGPERPRLRAVPAA